MRDRARAVVVGGGVGGCAILYWLARLGWSDALLVERADLTSGSTFHSAGLVGQLRGSLSLTKMMMSSVELYRELGDEVGLETGWREVGSLRLASSQERMEELARQAGWAKTFGLPLELVSAEEAERLFPPLATDGVLGAAYLPTDGYVDPSQLTFALAEGARRRGAEIATHTRVTAVRTARNRVTAVETDRGVHPRRRVHPRPHRRARLLGRRGLLRPRSRRRGRDGQARRRVARRGRAEPRRLGDGLAPLRPPLREPEVHARALGRGVLDVLRREVPRARAAGRPAAPRLADVRAPGRARRRVG